MASIGRRIVRSLCAFVIEFHTLHQSGEWFRRFDIQYVQANQMSIKEAQLEIICLAEQLKKKRAELTLLQFHTLHQSDNPLFTCFYSALFQLNPNPLSAKPISALLKNFCYSNAYLIISAIGRIPETLRIACASLLVNHYGPNRVCQSLKIRKSNLFYHLLRKPEVTAYEKHNHE